MPVTLLYAGVLALLSVLLANYVLYIRLRANVLPEWQPKAAERVQANFVENVPLALVLLYLVEVAGAMPALIHGCGIVLVVLRVLHAWGLARYQGANYPRLIGAQGTFVLLSVLGAAALYMSLV
ncbi:MAG: MAPEG family protein [Pseudomonadota bacterium]